VNANISVWGVSHASVVLLSVITKKSFSVSIKTKHDKYDH
jgi:hypothetical protein